MSKFSWFNTYSYIMLVGGIPTPLKNMKVRLDHHPSYWGKSKMFQTTNQLWYIIIGQWSDSLFEIPENMATKWGPRLR